MITGGLGFIGSNLARQLVDLGARVLIVDSLIPEYGGNLFNIRGIEDRVRVNIADVRQQSTMNYLVREQDVIFNLAGQVSHIDSMQDPYTDLEINCRSQLSMLEACRSYNPAVKVVFAGTRQVYGRPDTLPVTESHLVRPTDVNGINKAAGEYYHLVYNNVFGVRACSLRLTNVYGPRQLLKHNRQGFIGWFIRLAVEDREIQIYGDGRSCAISSTSTMRPTRSCARARATPATARCSTSAAPSRSAHRELVELLDRRRRHRAATGSSSGRPRRRRSTSATSTPTRRSSSARSAGSRARPLRDGLRTDDRVLPRAPATTTCTDAAAPVARAVSAPARHPVPRSRARRRRRRGPRRRSSASLARGWFVLGPEVEAFEAEFAAACGARVRGRRRQRHRRDRAAAARARHRRRRRGDRAGDDRRLHRRSP